MRTPTSRGLQLEPSEWASAPPSAERSPPSAALAVSDSVSAVILFRSACMRFPGACDKGGRSQRAPSFFVLIRRDVREKNGSVCAKPFNFFVQETTRQSSQHWMPTRAAWEVSQRLSTEEKKHFLLVWYYSCIEATARKTTVEADKSARTLHPVRTAPLLSTPTNTASTKARMESR